jgi:hypothetical protein
MLRHEPEVPRRELRPHTAAWTTSSRTTRTRSPERGRHGQPFATYWMQCAHIWWRPEMSKSRGTSHPARVLARGYTGRMPTSCWRRTTRAAEFHVRLAGRGRTALRRVGRIHGASADAAGNAAAGPLPGLAQARRSGSRPSWTRSQRSAQWRRVSTPSAKATP